MNVDIFDAAIRLIEASQAQEFREVLSNVLAEQESSLRSLNDLASVRKLRAIACIDSATTGTLLKGKLSYTNWNKYLWAAT